jgi:hypothetical protein
MKSQWSVVVLVGMLAFLARVAGLATVADVAAVAYLLTATVVFDRQRRIEPARAHATRPE